MFEQIEKRTIPEVGSDISPEEYEVPEEIGKNPSLVGSEGEGQTLPEESPFIDGRIIESAEEQLAVGKELDSQLPDEEARKAVMNKILADQEHGFEDWASLNAFVNGDTIEKKNLS